MTPRRKKNDFMARSEVLLARDAKRHTEVCQAVRIMHTVKAKLDVGRRKNADADPRRAMGDGMCSKLTEMVPLRKATTETLQKAIRERIVARYAVPNVMVTENGVQFTSRSFKRFLKELGVRHPFTAPHTPQENPERANRTVKTMIA